MSSEKIVTEKLIPVLIIAGPTAVGKSGLAMRLAERLKGSILSADSMQVYEGMPIGTAQPSDEDKLRVPHHLVGHVPAHEEYNVARFVKEAEAILRQEWEANRPVIIAGGTGLFLRHLIEGIFPGPPKDDALRFQLQAKFDAEGEAPLRERLREVDPEREGQILPNDSVRLIRALEVFELTGKPMSQWHQEDQGTRQLRPHRYFVLDRQRENLRNRINLRVDQMLEMGWEEEARLLFEKVEPTCQSARALGYREWHRYFQGECALEETVEEIKLRTRQFAKRQVTWFRSVKTAEWLNLEEQNEDQLLNLLESAYHDLMKSIT